MAESDQVTWVITSGSSSTAVGQLSFNYPSTDVTGNIVLPNGVEMVMPGDNLTITVDLIQPIALNVGLRFAIREGGRTVGAGQVTEILD